MLRRALHRRLSIQNRETADRLSNCKAMQVSRPYPFSGAMCAAQCLRVVLLGPVLCFVPLQLLPAVTAQMAAAVIIIRIPDSVTACGAHVSALRKFSGLPIAIIGASALAVQDSRASRAVIAV